MESLVAAKSVRSIGISNGTIIDLAELSAKDMAAIEEG